LAKLDRSGHDHIRVECDQFRRVPAQAGVIARAPAIINPHVASDGPARLLKSLLEDKLYFDVRRKTLIDSCD
jgi:hypothetical protein